MKLLFWNDKQQGELNAWAMYLSKLGVKYNVTEYKTITQLKITIN